MSDFAAIILRGGSGAGKTTWTRHRYPGGIIVSADHYMVDEEGDYEFDLNKLGEAHGECLRTFVGYVQNPPLGADTIVVDNTNTMVAEFAPYAQLALAYGLSLKVLTFVYDPVTAYQRNIHGTPLKTCIQMHTRMMEQTQHIPPWWDHDYILSRALHDIYAPED